MAINDTVDRLADELALSTDDRSQLMPSRRQTTFANRVHLAKSFLGKAGLVELTRRAHFRITDRGREVLSAPPDRIDIKFLSRYPEFERFREAEARAADQNGPATDTSQGAATTLTPDEQMRSAHRAQRPPSA